MLLKDKGIFKFWRLLVVILILYVCGVLSSVKFCGFWFKMNNVLFLCNKLVILFRFLIWLYLFGFWIINVVVFVIRFFSLFKCVILCDLGIIINLIFL